MNAPRILLCVAVPAMLMGCATTPSPTASSMENPVPPQLLEQEYQYELVKHLYRWYLDEDDVEDAIHKKTWTFYIRDLNPALDDDDNSELGSVVMPELDVTLTVKKADYQIPKLGIQAKNDTFKIINVARGTPSSLAGYTPVNIDYAAMRDYGFRTRNEVQFPDEDLLMRLRVTAREALMDDLRADGKEPPEGEQIIHLSPLSPVASELWLFWETGRMLLRYASDVDLADPKVWDHDELMVESFNIDEQVVVSLDEVSGSNAYMTRDQVGRALFNCVVLGKRMALQPLENTE